MPDIPTGSEAQIGFGEAISVIRTRAGLSQAELATRAGMSVAEVSKLELGEGDPTWGTGRQLAHGLGMPLSAVAVVAELLDEGFIELAGKPVSGLADGGR